MRSLVPDSGVQQDRLCVDKLPNPQGSPPLRMTVYAQRG